MKARKIKVTIKVVEESKGDDYSMKVKINTEKLSERKPLADSTVEYYAQQLNNWMTQNKASARNDVLKGRISERSTESWVEDEGVAKPKPIVKPTPKPASERTDSELTLAELRVKYPDIKATSVKTFLEKI